MGRSGRKGTEYFDAIVLGIFDGVIKLGFQSINMRNRDMPPLSYYFPTEIIEGNPNLEEGAHVYYVLLRREAENGRRIGRIVGVEAD